MVEPGKTEKGDDFTCPHCGAVYTTTIFKSPITDRDSATCVVCRSVMDEWTSTRVPTYALKV